MPDEFPVAQYRHKIHPSAKSECLSLLSSIRDRIFYVCPMLVIKDKHVTESLD